MNYRGIAEVQWKDCVWPGNWSNVEKARGRFFRKLAAKSLNEHDISGAIKALSSALASCPDCWEEGVLLARLYEHIGQFAPADELFYGLAQRFPEHRGKIALQHHDALLASQRYLDLHQLAWLNLANEDASSWSWFVPYILTTNLLEDPASIWVNHATESTILSVEQRDLLSIVASTSSSTPVKTVERVLSTPSSTPIVARLRWELLISAGHREAAIRSIQQDRERLSSFEYRLAQWATLKAEVPVATFQQFWERAIPAEPEPYQVDRLLAIALKTPRAPQFESLRDHISDSNQPSLASLWLVSSLKADYELADRLIPLLPIENDEKKIRLSLANISKVLPGLAGVLPLSREIHYATLTAISDYSKNTTSGD